MKKILIAILLFNSLYGNDKIIQGACGYYEDYANPSRNASMVYLRGYFTAILHLTEGKTNDDFQVVMGRKDMMVMCEGVKGVRVVDIIQSTRDKIRKNTPTY